MILLDSNAYLWLLYYPQRIGPLATAQLSDGQPVSVSVVTLWELAIKFSKGLLPYSPTELSEGITALGVDLMPIVAEHLKKLPAISLPQKDPFDRLLVAQSETQGCTFLTSDAAILHSEYKAADVTT